MAILKTPTHFSRISARFVTLLTLPNGLFAHLTSFVLEGELEVLESELFISLDADKLTVENRQFSSFLWSYCVASVTFKSLVLTPPIVHIYPVGRSWAHAAFVIPKPSDTSVNCIPTWAFGR